MRVCRRAGRVLWAVVLAWLTGVGTAAAAPAAVRVRAPEAEAAFIAGRYGEAQGLVEAALERCRPTPTQPDRCLLLMMTGSGYALAAGDAGAAERLANQAIGLSATLRDGRGELAMSRISLANALAGQGRIAEAEDQTRQALALARVEVGEGHILTGSIQNTLALLLTAQGRAAEAEPLQRAALTAIRSAMGDRHPTLPTLMSGLADNLAAQARYREAADAQVEALALARAINGPQHPATAVVLNGLGRLRQTLGAFSEAEALYEAAAAIDASALGVQHPLAGRDASNLGQLYLEQGRLAEAETQFRRALAIAEAASGPSHPAVATDLGDLATVFALGGRPEAGEPLLRRSLEIERTAFGEDTPRMAAQYGALAANLEDQRRPADAEPLRRRALKILRTSSGEAHPDTAHALAGAAGNLVAQGRRDDARPLLLQALEVQEAALGADSLAVAGILSQIGVLEAQAGNPGAAESAFRRALAIRRARLGESSPATATGHHNLAAALELAGRPEAAEAPARAALGLRRAILPDGHPDIAASEALLARILAPRANAAALEHARAAMTLVRTRRLQAGAAGDAAARAELRARSAQSTRDPADRAFAAFLAAAAQSPDPDTLGAEAFLAAQDLEVSAAGLAMAQTAARTAAGAGDLARLARRQQDLSSAIRVLDAQAVQALGAGLSDKASALRVAIETAARDLAAVEADLREHYPGYATLVSPQPLSLEEVQARLAPGEGLLLITPADGDIYVFAVGRRGLSWRRLPGGVDSLAEQVAVLRCGLDPLTCGSARAAAAFDPRLAHALYVAVVRPVEPALVGVRRLFVTAGGPLASLPVDALAVGVPRSGDLRRVRWLADRYAVTSLPAVAVLRPKGVAKVPRGTGGFVGYGDPAFGGGGSGDLGVLRRMEPLPGTRQELDAMARALGAPPSSLVLGAAATEPAVRSDPRLAEARVVAFATHGLLPGELNGRNEPGLVFTPPAATSPGDDGLLGASEVAQMSFRAEWVILSACNTGSAEGGSDSLSALARAFLYAGAEALVASHWRVADDATAALTVEMLAAEQADPRLSRAEARQRAMRAVRTGRRTDGSAVAGWTPDWRDPTAWAPFTLIAASSD